MGDHSTIRLSTGSQEIDPGHPLGAGTSEGESTRHPGGGTWEPLPAEETDARFNGT